MRKVFVGFLGLGMLALGFVPQRAHACWDGFRATSAHVELTGDDDQWSLGQARDLGRWMTRFEALVGSRGAHLEYSGIATVTLAQGEAIDFPSRRWTWEALFDATARALGVSARERRAAMAATTEVLTVEVVGVRDVAEARRLAHRINEDELGDHGFYEAGGFPAQNDTAHVIRRTAHGANPGGTHRLVVGTFLDRASAERAARALEAAIGRAVRVRPL